MLLFICFVFYNINERGDILDNYKLKLDIEPSDEYQKAKLDLCKAKESFDKLTDKQKEELLEEYGFGELFRYIKRNQQ